MATSPDLSVHPKCPNWHQVPLLWYTTGTVGALDNNVAKADIKPEQGTRKVCVRDAYDQQNSSSSMLKYQKWLSSFVVALVLWLCLVQFASTSVADPRILQVVYVLPVYALVTFGAYSLAVIAMSVMAVTDCPEAAKELDRQVIEAKEDLRKRGLKI